MQRRCFIKLATSGAIGLRLCPFSVLASSLGTNACSTDEEKGACQSEGCDQDARIIEDAGSGLYDAQSESDGDAGVESNPIIGNRSHYDVELMLQFYDSVVPWEQPVWIEQFGQETAKAIDQEARKEWEQMVPRIPYIGEKRVGRAELMYDGEYNFQFLSLFHSCLQLARYHTLKRRGESAEVIGDLLLRALEKSLEAIPFEMRQAFNTEWFNQERIRAQTADEMLRARVYPDAYVARFVEGDDATFDWGYDVLECGVIKFFSKEGAEELVPYICPGDDLMSDIYGLGLVRTQLLSKGDDRCDFRYKRQEI